MICQTCQSPNNEGARFCQSCGAALSLSETPTRVAPDIRVADDEVTLVREYSQSGASSSPVGVSNYQQGGLRDSLTGRTIEAKYRLVAKLGAGGMGAVYRATRLVIGDEVAIKILHADENDQRAAERFRREAQAAARLKHPNAVNIYDFGVTEDGLQYLVMELVEGESLRQIIKQQGPLTPSAAAEIISQVCAALDEAHRHNIIHRDIKPDNIIVEVAANRLRVKVLDFGIAKLRDDTAGNLTQTGSVLGTPHYMSPEQCLGEELDRRSDIYSLGIVLYEMLAGVVPFNSPISTAVVVQHVNQPPPSLRSLNTSISSPVEHAVLHALEKQRQRRPETAGKFAQELNASVSANVREPTAQLYSQPLSQEPTVVMTNLPSSGALPVPPEFQPTKRRVFGYLAVGLGALVLGGAIVLLARWNGETGSSRATSTSTPSPTPRGSGSRSPFGIKATASSERIPKDGNTYYASNLLDQNWGTAWDEGVPGPGIGEWIRCDFDREVKLNRIIITPGYFKTPAIWRQNNRVASATFYFSNAGSQRVTFPDRMIEQRLEVGGISTSWVRMVIEEIYPGSTDMEDTPISSLVFDWEGSSTDGPTTQQSHQLQTTNLSESELRAASWFVVLGSYSKADLEKANQRLKFIQGLGHDARIVDTDDYPNLRRGLWAVVMGPYAKPAARKVAQGLRSAVAYAYVK
jgi:serine/threonine protein kinase